jgi:PIN like domain
MIGSPSPHKPTLFIDRNSGGRTFRTLIEDRGIVVTLHDDHFSDTTGDDVWLRAIGDEGWIMVTGDIAISRTPLFLLRLAQSTARVFILNGLNGASPAGKAECVIANYERIVSICLERSGPMLWKFNKDGSRKEINFRKHLQRMKRHRRI